MRRDWVLMEVIVMMSEVVDLQVMSAADASQHLERRARMVCGRTEIRDEVA